MPTRKQKRREAKSKRHDYEIVYVDDDGNEVEPPPEAETRTNGSKPVASKAAAPARGGRKQPQPPSWQRAGRRAALLGIVVFIIFSTLNKSHNYGGAALVAVIYTVLFVPFTYALDRFAYKRFLQRQDAPAKKR